MAAQRPSIDEFMAQRTRPSIDEFMSSKVFQVGDGRTTIEAKPKAPDVMGAIKTIAKQHPVMSAINPKTVSSMVNYSSGPAVFAGTKEGREYAPDAFQAAGSVAGTLGGTALGGPWGGRGGAVLGGGAGRALGYGAKTLGLGRVPHLSELKKEALVGGGTEVFGEGLNAALQGIRKPAGLLARKIMTNYLNPTGEMAQKAPELVSTMLEKGIKGGHREALETLLTKAGNQTDELNSIIEKFKNREVNHADIWHYLNEEIKSAVENQNPVRAKSLSDPKNMFKQAYLEPKTISYQKRIGEDVDQAYEVTPITKEVKRKMMVRRPVTVGESQKRKLGQYGELEKIRKANVWVSDAQAGDIAARKEYARGLRRATEKAIPEVDIAGKNREIGKLLDVAKVIEKRAPVAERNAPVSLTDTILGGLSVLNPGVSVPAIMNKAGRMSQFQNSAAHGLYDLSKKEFLKNPAARAILARLAEASNN